MERSVRWPLFEHKGLGLVFETKKLAEKAWQKYSEQRVRKIGLGVVRVP
jgi:hypothetical protein